MGRKGIGKLAPFGICKRIEVRSAGGKETPQGYLVAHFFLDYDLIMSLDDDSPVKLEAGKDDRTFDPKTGTIIRLSQFQPKRVPDEVTFKRQLATRFSPIDHDFRILVHDITHPLLEPFPIEPNDIPIDLETRIDLNFTPVITNSGEELRVSGWLAKARDPYKNEELAGVRIYARKKLVAITRDFEQPAGFTGEFTIRSYLVGEVYADWLDLDEGEDLIRSDRQGILWESEYGSALKSWGAKLIREIGAASQGPKRRQNRDSFLKVSNFVERANRRYQETEVANAAIQLAEQIGSFADDEELKDEKYVDSLAEIILTVAPHKALIDAFQEFSRQANLGEVTLERLIDLFGKARVAEMASYSQIAAERVQSIQELERIVLKAKDDESQFQRLLARSPWLIEPTWSAITMNQALKTFKSAFEQFWYTRTGIDISLDIGETVANKRPDFTLVHVGQMLHIVEIKKAGHDFDDADFERLLRYVDAFTEFFDKHRSLLHEFPRGWRIDLIADGEKLNNRSHVRAYESMKRDGLVLRKTWVDFLHHAKTAHEQFLIISDRYRERNKQLLSSSD